MIRAAAAAAAIASSFGSGSFGEWRVDERGLPAYRYTIDEAVAPQAAQPEMLGRRDAWHQVGNDHVVANTFNRGYTQLWTMDRLYQWANYVESGHHGGGFGWLNVDGDKTGTTLYADRADGQEITRDFGVGYSRARTTIAGIDVSSRVYAPFGDDPLLLHDVVLRNTDDEPHDVAWFEYWDVNPYAPGTKSHPGFGAPVLDGGTFTVAQSASATDTAPLTIFAAPLKGRVEGFETSADAFFGAGGRELPDAVEANAMTDSIAAAAPNGSAGRTLFAMRSPVTLRPGQTRTLRYAFGQARTDLIPALVDRYRQRRAPYAASARGWKRFVPKARLGRKWLNRELQWSAYMVRSGTTYEQCAGKHIISQGGYYQYDLGFQGAFRDPLQHVLPLIHSYPFLVREVLEYSAQQQLSVGGPLPWARISGCRRLDLGSSNDLDLWLLLTAAEYGLATRDTGFFDTPVRWADGGTAPLWDHLVAAVDGQEAQRGPNGGYVSGTTGDWSDLSTPLIGMTESSLVTAQAAYVYPRMAELARLRGDGAFAERLEALGEDRRAATAKEWSERGWYARGYRAGAVRFGVESIYGEPQPWALLAGVPSAAQAEQLVANIRKHLIGPDGIGASQSPAADDPGAGEKEVSGQAGVGNDHAVYVGGSWYAINGWLTWALGRSGFEALAFDELKRNTLARRATVYPDHWNGITSVDDACRSWYSDEPQRCGVGLSVNYTTQIMHQPAWQVYAAVKLAGVEPTAAGYTIDPHLPLKRFSLRLPQVGVTRTARGLRGYVRAETALTLRVAARGRARVNGRRVRSARDGRFTVLTLPRGGRWSVG